MPAFVKACKAAGERNLIDELLDPFRLLVDAGKAPEDVAAAVRLFQIRPWYSAEELAFLWPLVSIGLAGKEHAWRPDPAQLHKRLVACGLPRLKDWGGGYTFTWQGQHKQWFIVQHVRQLSRLRFTQTDFERFMQPT